MFMFPVCHEMGSTFVHRNQFHGDFFNVDFFSYQISVFSLLGKGKLPRDDGASADADILHIILNS